MRFSDETAVMQRALELARLGAGAVEPNPCVGAVIVDSELNLLGEGNHERYGGPHAEVMALRQAGDLARGATIFVTLEPCAHHGKTPPCADAVIQAGIRRVVCAVEDPAGHNQGAGFERLRTAGIAVEVGLGREEGEELLAPFTTLMTQGRPFVHAKWAMTLDGKIASRTGSSKWITNTQSRERVHQLRGRMDAVLVGVGTVVADDPLLTARPAGVRRPVRIVLDPVARTPLNSQLLQTQSEGPLLFVVSESADTRRVEELRNLGAEVYVCPLQSDGIRFDLTELLAELARRRMTNLFVEGGRHVLGAFQDAGFIDEVHCFIAPKIIGGLDALTPVGGTGGEMMPEMSSLLRPRIEVLGDNVYITGRVRR
ncbi:bifunctional diaminohydroxyphosphoribosylaminopyrimidine deaminase/5-amino-6-(5-phosphoribosylamino)uracil reductase RibD [Planctomicrobium sp. SH527]|uniref:bifunctional diaminohydroxyphosphoribosylaminopyrimidine deaminase/5-amino-6-(5-phosphoribosylamino)uracil reductase RibD n=1 Tax=Planctomicrobium sp. SH527 TaxID=3448123 RepID=UPI003F5C30FD